MASTDFASPKHGADVPRGCSFTPGHEELLSVYLRRKIARAPLPAATACFFHDADVYAADPATLVAGFLAAPESTVGERKSWFFFSPVRPKTKSGARDGRKSRMVGDGEGTWKAERGKDVVDGEGRFLGHLHRFTYKTKDGGKPGWLMVEYGVDQEDDDEGHRGEPVPVLCKIYQSPRFLASSSKSSSSASSRKRNAPDERHDQASSCPVRRRLFLSSPPAPTPPDEGHPAFDLRDFLLPAEPQPEPEESQGETSPLDRSFSMADHAGSALSCYGTTLLRPGADRGIPPCAPDVENSASWTGGMEFLACLPTAEDLWSSIAGSGQDASYWFSEPSAPGSAAAAASTLLCSGMDSCNAIAAP